MSLPPDRHDELLALLGAIRDERINAAEFERLERLLAEFPQAREIFLQYITLHAALEQAGAAELTPGRLREIIRDEQTVQELRSMIAADERSAFATRAHRSKRRRYLAATLTAAALVLLAVFVGQRVLLKPSVAASSAQIAAVYGPVESSAAGVRLPIAPGPVVRPGTSLKTGPNAYLRLQYPDGSTLDLKDATELALLDETQAKRLKLVAGTAFFDVAPQPAGTPLIVNPGQHDQVKVAGTSFQVSRDQAVETRLLVVRGSVLFGADAAAVPVTANQGSAAPREQTPSLPEPFDRAAIWQGLSRGLTATYYAGADLTGKSVTRVDPKVDFDWGKGPPDPALGPDQFSVRWTGQIEPEHTEPYTLYVFADEGARLWIDGKLVIDGWKNVSGEKVASPPIDLVAGRKYDLKLEYHESEHAAAVQLWWSSPSTPKDIVPHAQLYPSP